MKSRWYISVLIIILTLLGGVASQQQVCLPNQEIVLQFTDNEVTTDETLNAITIIKQQLLDIGVDNIQVAEQEDGQLKITYYSNIDVVRIKKLLSTDNDLGFNSKPYKKGNKPVKPSSNENLLSYNLDVYEIHNGNTGASDLGGKLALEQKPENIRFFNPNFYVPFNEVIAKENDKILKVAYIFQRNIAIAINNTPHKIPEVRAGPLC